MNDFSLLIGGRAGDGIDKSGEILARIINKLGRRLYIYRDYPSLIRGGHTFSIIRASEKRIATHSDKVDCILALNQDTINFHKHRLREGSFVIYDSDLVKPEGLELERRALAVPLEKIVKGENAPLVVRNSCITGSFCKTAGIGWDLLETVFRKNISKDLDLNLKVAMRGYNEAKELVKLGSIPQESLPLLTGNQAIGLGLIKAGLNSFIAYPMTPSSTLLHYLAGLAEEFSLKVIHPESEIGVIMMALGFSYCGERVAVGTSGGGFCLMVEGFSFAGMAELPITIVLGQRTGPSTGLPTYTGQTELHFALNAGQGEFPRFIVAPGDGEEAYYWSSVSSNISWKYQIPSIILADKTLCEGTYSFDGDVVEEIRACEPAFWDGTNEYKRYFDTETGVSPLAFVPRKDAIIKVNSYEHDEFGITTEDPFETKRMNEKRLRKETYLIEELSQYRTVNVDGSPDSSAALLTWGSNKGVCLEAARKAGLKFIQPLVLSPFPVEQFKKALAGVKKLICVENNATSQLGRLISSNGFHVDEKILKYDGRPFSLDELEDRLENLLAGLRG